MPTKKTTKNSQTKVMKVWWLESQVNTRGRKVTKSYKFSEHTLFVKFARPGLERSDKYKLFLCTMQLALATD